MSTSAISINVNAPGYGVVADGGYHPLSASYATLALAQVDYPAATSLSQTKDEAGILAAVADALAAVGVSGINPELIYEAGEYVVTSLSLVGKSRLTHRALGTVALVGYNANSATPLPSVLNLNGGIVESVTPIRKMKMLGNWSVGVHPSSPGGYTIGVDVSNMTGSELWLTAGGRFASKAMSFNFGWDNTLYLDAANEETQGTVWAIYTGYDSWNDNRMWFRASCSETITDYSQESTVARLAGIGNHYVGDASMGKYGVDYTGARSCRYMIYFEHVKINAVAGIGSGFARGNTFLSGRYSIPAGGFGFQIGSGGGAYRTQIIGGMASPSGGAGGTFIDYTGGQAYLTNIQGVDIDPSITYESGTYPGAKTGTLPFMDRLALAGVSFPPTNPFPSADPNTLDDYEEGDWTPALTLTSGSVTYSAQGGKYTKIGRQVTVTGLVTLATVSSPSGAVTIALPFTAGSGVAYSSPVTLFIQGLHDVPYKFEGYVNGAEIRFYWLDATGWPGSPGAMLKAGGTIMFTATYFV